MCLFSTNKTQLKRQVYIKMRNFVMCFTAFCVLFLTKLDARPSSFHIAFLSTHLSFQSLERLTRLRVVSYSPQE